jgi:hypothetical protein
MLGYLPGEYDDCHKLLNCYATRAYLRFNCFFRVNQE